MSMSNEELLAAAKEMVDTGVANPEVAQEIYKRLNVSPEVSEEA